MQKRPTRAAAAILMRRMAEIARARGRGGFSADVLAGNEPMLVVFRIAAWIRSGRLDPPPIRSKSAHSRLGTPDLLSSIASPIPPRAIKRSSCACPTLAAADCAPSLGVRRRGGGHFSAAPLAGA